MSKPTIEPLFVEEGDWRRFALLVSPSPVTPARGALLFLPAFAEEMNKARRMVALGARALAGRGWTVLMLDPFGCGDSPGDFGDAHWETWVDDATRAHKWLHRRTHCAPGLWGMRAGALLASAVATRLQSVPDLLLWQPVLSGRTHLNQFLRLKVAAAALGSSGTPVRTADLLEELERGGSVEIAGYRLAPLLALPMQAASLEFDKRAECITWLEVSASDPPCMTPVSSDAIQRLVAGGAVVNPEVVAGPPFWQTQEIEECHSLIDATITLLGRDGYSH